MEFHYPQRVRLGQGVSQQLGPAIKDKGSRVLLLTESALEASKELGSLTHSLERAGVPFLLQSKTSRKSIPDFQKECHSLALGSRMDVLVAMGGNDLLSLARSVVAELPSPQKVSYFEVPTGVCYPLLLRAEAFLTTGHPSDMRFLPLPPLSHQVFIDPHMTTGQTPKTSVILLLEALFYATEAYFHEAAGLFELSLLGSAIKTLWETLQKIHDNPANAEYRLHAAQAGFNVALALSSLPRAAGLTFAHTLAGIAGVSSSTFGSLFLAPFLENYGPKAPERIASLAGAFGLSDYEGGVETLGPKIAQEVRRFLNMSKLPMRLGEFQLVETQIHVAADVVRGFSLARGGVLDAEKLTEFLSQIQ
jgi:hypothetical protein